MQNHVHGGWKRKQNNTYTFGQTEITFPKMCVCVCLCACLKSEHSAQPGFLRRGEWTGRPGFLPAAHGPYLRSLIRKQAPLWLQTNKRAKTFSSTQAWVSPSVREVKPNIRTEYPSLHPCYTQKNPTYCFLPLRLSPHPSPNCKVQGSLAYLRHSAPMGTHNENTKGVPQSFSSPLQTLLMHREIPLVGKGEHSCEGVPSHQNPTPNTVSICLKQQKTASLIWIPRNTKRTSPHIVCHCWQTQNVLMIRLRLWELTDTGVGLSGTTSLLP